MAPGGVDLYLGEVANKTFIFQTALYQAQTLIGDAFIVSSSIKVIMRSLLTVFVYIDVPLVYCMGERL